MITGIGTDLVKLSRIEDILQKRGEAFLRRFFTERELLLFSARKNLGRSVGANFAAKEALAKALGVGVRGFELREIGVLRDPMGKPYFERTAGYLALQKKYGFDRSHVSASHDGEYAVATVALESSEKNG